MLLFLWLPQGCSPRGPLVLSSPSNEDEGYFECTAVNAVGEERRVIKVLLQGVFADITSLFA